MTWFTNPKKSENNWSIKTDSGTCTDHEIIANSFNKFFVNKIDKLKEKRLDSKIK